MEHMDEDPTTSDKVYVMGRVMDWEPFLKAFQDSILYNQWSKATHHHMGKGLAEGFDVDQTRRQLKYYENLGQNLQRSMLSTTLGGGIWTSYRRYQDLNAGSPICPRCKGAVETDFHRYWCCPDNDQICLLYTSDAADE